MTTSLLSHKSTSQSLEDCVSEKAESDMRLSQEDGGGIETGLVQLGFQPQS